MNTFQNISSFSRRGKTMPGLAVMGAPSDFNDYTTMEDTNFMEALPSNTFDLSLSPDATAFPLGPFNPTGMSPFSQAFPGQGVNALGISEDPRFTPSVAQPEPVLPSQSAGDLERYSYMMASDSHSSTGIHHGNAHFMHPQASRSSESLHSTLTPVEVLNRAYSRSNSGSPASMSPVSFATPSHREQSLSPQAQILPPNSFMAHNSMCIPSTMSNIVPSTVSPVLLHSYTNPTSGSSKFAHSRQASTQEMRDMIEVFQRDVQFSPNTSGNQIGLLRKDSLVQHDEPYAFPPRKMSNESAHWSSAVQGVSFNPFPGTPGDGTVALLPSPASHHGHHRSQSASLMSTTQPSTGHPSAQMYLSGQFNQYPGAFAAALVPEQNSQYLCAISPSFHISPLQHSDLDDSAGGGDESGSSIYSPMLVHGHGRNLSTSTCGSSPFGRQSLSPLSRGGSIGATTIEAAAFAPDNTLIDPNVFGSSEFVQGPGKPARHTAVDAPLKRKRSVEAELDEDDGDDYDGNYGFDSLYPSGDEGDTDYTTDSDNDRSKKGKGTFKKGHTRQPSKKQHRLPEDFDFNGLDGRPVASTSQTKPKGSPTRQRTEPRKAPKLPERAGVKVDVLPDLPKTAKCCPICQHVPGNKRYSDLLRHLKTHLKVPFHYACTTCSKIERMPNGDSELVDGEYFTRKDSCKRHWSTRHKENTQEWDESFCLIVNRVRTLADAYVSSQ